MDRGTWFAPKWLWLKRFAAIALSGLGLAIAGALLQMESMAILGVFLFVPLIFWVAFIPILHWKDRYIGSSPNVWGAFLCFETSSWSKILYWFIHVLPDWKRSGAYADAP
jgi:hypothetical protein